LLNQYEFGTNCAVDKHTKMSVEICISTDIQKVRYRSVSYLVLTIIFDYRYLIKIAAFFHAKGLYSSNQLQPLLRLK